jgi:hypothetical protein
MLSGEAIDEGPEERYAALGFWKVKGRISAERVKKKPQS